MKAVPIGRNSRPARMHDEKGAIIVWRATDNAGTPPAADQGAVPEYRAGSAARFRTQAARPRTVVADWLGHDPAAGTAPQ